MTPDLEDLLACHLSGQMPERDWVEWCREYPELREMLPAQDKFAKVRALAAQGLPVASRDVRELLAAYDGVLREMKWLGQRFEEMKANQATPGVW